MTFYYNSENSVRELVKQTLLNIIDDDESDIAAESIMDTGCFNDICV